MFQLFTILSYANSAVNPLLYVFVNENFRQNCADAISFRRSSSLQPPVVLATPSSAERTRRRRVLVRLPAAAATTSGVVGLQTL